MANGYDSLSLKATGLAEAASSSDTTMSKMMPVAVRDKRFTKRGIGFRTQQEASTLDPGKVGQEPPEIMYPGGVATRKRGMDETQRPWETAQEATSPQIKPRATLERFGSMDEALPPWLKGKEGEDEEKEAAVALVRENMGAFPCEADARIALAVLSQFVDGDILASVQDAIEGQYGDPAEQPEPMPEPEWDDGDGYMGESALQEAPLDAKKRNALDSSDFALPGRRYPIDTPARARAALARVKQFGKDGEEAKVKAAVKKKYPNMDVS
jgi:hypothetical protein